MTGSASDRERGGRLLAAANRLSLARLAFVCLLGAVAAGHPATISWLEVGLIATLWTTDVLDGRLARRGQSLGAAPRADGRALDPVIDDAAYVVGFAVLLAAGIIPLWFLALVAITRSVFTLTRLTGSAQGHSFARPRITGKVKGVALAGGQCALAALAAASELGAPERSALLAAMTVACAVALADFAYAHRRVYAEAVRPRPLQPLRQVSPARQAAEPSPSVASPDASQRRQPRRAETSSR